MRIYIADLAAYNEGFLIGEHIELPVADLSAEVEEVLERTNVLRMKALKVTDADIENGEYYPSEEWAIHDHEDIQEWYGPVSEWEDLDELNEACEAYENLDEDQARGVAIILREGFKDTVKDAIEDLDNIICTGEKNMHDVAWEHIESCGMLENMPESLRGYFDYESFGRDMEIEGSFYTDDEGIIWEYIN